MEKNVEFGEKQAQVNKIVVMHVGGGERVTIKKFKLIEIKVNIMKKHTRSLVNSNTKLLEGISNALLEMGTKFLAGSIMYLYNLCVDMNLSQTFKRYLK